MATVLANDFYISPGLPLHYIFYKTILVIHPILYLTSLPPSKNMLSFIRSTGLGSGWPGFKEWRMFNVFVIHRTNRCISVGSSLSLVSTHSLRCDLDYDYTSWCSTPTKNVYFLRTTELIFGIRFKELKLPSDLLTLVPGAPLNWSGHFIYIVIGLGGHFNLHVNYQSDWESLF
jgi:hypothetical protein